MQTGPASKHTFLINLITVILQDETRILFENGPPLWEAEACLS